jgi:hypothetical protein
VASGPKPVGASAFDDMLTAIRGRLAALSPAGQAPDGVDRADARRDPARNTSKLARRFAPMNSVAASRLRQRFGDRWRCEMVTQPHEGDEIIVLCRLHVDDLGVVKTQFGHASIHRGPMTGRCGDVRFRIGATPTEQDETEAYQRAAEAALTKCCELL